MSQIKLKKPFRIIAETLNLGMHVGVNMYYSIGLHYVFFQLDADEPSHHILGNMYPWKADL